jgi:hypothetical protein
MGGSISLKVDVCNNAGPEVARTGRSRSENTPLRCDDNILTSNHSPFTFYKHYTYTAFRLHTQSVQIHSDLTHIVSNLTLCRERGRKFLFYFIFYGIKDCIL